MEMLNQQYDDAIVKMAAKRGITVAELETEMQAAVDMAWDKESKSFKEFPSNVHMDVLVMMLMRDGETICESIGE